MDGLGQSSSHNEEKSKKKETKTKKGKKIQKKIGRAPESLETIEQSSFIVTRETQRDFDENYEPDCTFMGGY